jgi:hypothetical protein
LPYCPNCGAEVASGSQFCSKCGRNLGSASAGVSPPPPSTYPIGAIDPDASTARTLTLVAIILQVIFFVIGIFTASLFFAIAPIASNFNVTCFTTTNGITTCTTTSSNAGTSISFFGIFLAIFAFAFVISIVWIALDYFLIYRNLGSVASIPRARTPALLLGIIQLLFGGVIPGILLIVAYLKIGDSIRRREQPYQAGWK